MTFVMFEDYFELFLILFNTDFFPNLRNITNKRDLMIKPNLFEYSTEADP